MKSNQQELVEEVINYENLPIFKCIEGYESKQPSKILNYYTDLKVLDMKMSEAEGVGEVLYFLEDPLVPHLKKYFEEVIPERGIVIINADETIPLGQGIPDNEPCQPEAIDEIPTTELNIDSSDIQN